LNKKREFNQQANCIQLKSWKWCN